MCGDEGGMKRFLPRRPRSPRPRELVSISFINPTVYPDTGWVKRAVVGTCLVLAPESNNFVFFLTPNDYSLFCSKSVIAFQ